MDILYQEISSESDDMESPLNVGPPEPVVAPGRLHDSDSEPYYDPPLVPLADPRPQDTAGPLWPESRVVGAISLPRRGPGADAQTFHRIRAGPYIRQDPDDAYLREAVEEVQRHEGRPMPPARDL